MALSDEEHSQAMMRIAAGLKLLMEATSLGCRKGDWYRFSSYVRLTDDSVEFHGVQLETTSQAKVGSAESARSKN